MKDLVAALIGVVVIVMVARDLVMGFRNGRMAILATGAPKADRVANPNLFRVYTAFNVFLLIAMVFVLFSLTRERL
ncbi:hypothetical protein JKL49_16830 [Phenylobacterium sp. 20VBR1]|uniref:Uncharacterized protein n=1 Tax=Phenylobacterium glaciei TaxID=2803784 RepID=A0A941HY45_9CAUL|nr:hypothetical protein [Phenylobacterium glaciei]MBR7621060.1 hypothetical protein [Phenylobacterium glaciei]